MSQTLSKELEVQQGDWPEDNRRTTPMSRQCCGGPEAGWPEAWGRIRGASEELFEQSLEEEA